MKYLHISIHAPRTGSDGFLEQPLCPADIISIHAPRTGSDAIFARRMMYASLFQSTLPARGATIRADCYAVISYADFNPRSPHGERPLLAMAKGKKHIDFNPRSPHGERQFPC